MKKVGIIPARLESSRFPEKLLHIIHEKSLLQRTYENAKKCLDLDEVFIATDHPKIKAHAEQFEAKTILTGPCENGTERIAKAIAITPYLNDCEYIVNIQGDHPAISSDTISSILSVLEIDTQADVSTPVIGIKDPQKIASSHTVKCVFDKRSHALYFSRSVIPFAADIYYQHLGVYAYRREFLLKMAKLASTSLEQIEDLEQLKILEHGYTIKVVIVKDVDISIDILDDIDQFKKHLCQSSTSL